MRRNRLAALRCNARQLRGSAGFKGFDTKPAAHTALLGPAGRLQEEVQASESPRRLPAYNSLHSATCQKPAGLPVTALTVSPGTKPC